MIYITHNRPGYINLTVDNEHLTENARYLLEHLGDRRWRFSISKFGMLGTSTRHNKSRLFTKHDAETKMPQCSRVAATEVKANAKGDLEFSVPVKVPDPIYHKRKSLKTKGQSANTTLETVHMRELVSELNKRKNQNPEMVFDFTRSGELRVLVEYS